MRWDVSADDCASSDHCPFTDSHIWQNDTMRTDEDILFDHNFTVAHGASRTRVKVRDDGRSEADCAIVPDAYVRGMYLIDVHELPDPDIFADGNSP